MHQKSQKSAHMSLVYPRLSRAGLTAFSIIIGGPHIRICVPAAAAGKCALI